MLPYIQLGEARSKSQLLLSKGKRAAKRTNWQSYLQLIGQGDLYRVAPRFANIGTRTEHAHDLYAYVSEQMATKTTAEWLELLLNADIPATPPHTLKLAAPGSASFGARILPFGATSERRSNPRDGDSGPLVGRQA